MCDRAACRAFLAGTLTVPFERTGVDRATIVKVLNGKAQFWDIYGQRFKKALEEEDDADADE